MDDVSLSTPQSMVVLLVEDDARLAHFTAEFLEKNSVRVVRASDGETAIAEASRTQFDAIVLDLMLPRRDGIDVCRTLRARSDIPIIMVSARGEEIDRVLGLELGADDYLTKPFSPRELLARLRANVRRARGQAGPSDRPIRVGKLSISPRSRSASLDGRELTLTTCEFDILRVLAERKGRVLNRETLLELVGRSAEDSFDRAIDVHLAITSKAQ
ncbi:MAG: response regulator transcription factor [Polyangiaceae bacterium]